MIVEVCRQDLASIGVLLIACRWTRGRRLVRLLQVEPKVAIALLCSATSAVRVEALGYRPKQLLVLVRLVLIFVLVFFVETDVLMSQIVVVRIDSVAEVHVKRLAGLNIVFTLLCRIGRIFRLLERTRLRAEKTVEAA